MRFSSAGLADICGHVMILWPLSQQIRQQLLVEEARRKNQECFSHYELFGFHLQNFF
jgi:hypothetical protein